ncbi:hypothetical protein [Hymenobacter coccineus]|uniref:Uncharacterized protein n=1 Tax=Hymenobacter coccineus TaxID=1908235 RepID=A0A1G1TKK6_9BACT|nr:hypothetical protein [Hymenobacter coccineus]OGX91416.1 hypothetical protein BEN49_19850 [Hymenobacter coccineus]
MPDSTTPPAPPSLADFACFCLYGLTDNPYRQAADVARFGQLYDLVVGPHGGVGVGSTFHPYQLVSPAGVTVWYAAFAQLYAQPGRAALFGALAEEQARYVVAPPASFADFHLWPDTRLTSTENPVFSRYIPFVLPLLVRRGPGALRWDTEAAAAAAEPERFRAYRAAVNEALRFVQPEPAFVLGLAEFDEQHPERLIDRFLAAKPLLGPQ